MRGKLVHELYFNCSLGLVVTVWEWVRVMVVEFGKPRLGTSGFVASIGGKRREEPRSPARETFCHAFRVLGDELWIWSEGQKSQVTLLRAIASLI